MPFLAKFAVTVPEGAPGLACLGSPQSRSKRMHAAARPRPVRRAQTNRVRARLHAGRMQQVRLQQEQIVRWLQQFDLNQSGKLERDELGALLMHLHPESGWPDSRALDLLITQATELRTYSLQLKGDPNGAVGRDMLMPVVSGYAMYLLAAAAFEKRACEGVVALSDLPALMREANAGIECKGADVDFVVDCASSSRGGHLDSASTISREDLIPAFAAWKITQIHDDVDALQEEEAELDECLREDMAEADDEDLAAFDGESDCYGMRLRELEEKSNPPVVTPVAHRIAAWAGNNSSEPCDDSGALDASSGGRPWARSTSRGARSPSGSSTASPAAMREATVHQQQSTACALL